MPMIEADPSAELLAATADLGRAHGAYMNAFLAAYPAASALIHDTIHHAAGQLVVSVAVPTGTTIVTLVAADGTESTLSVLTPPSPEAAGAVVPFPRLN